jgi:D-alanyl-D-alanine carboxypeptidase
MLLPSEYRLINGTDFDAVPACLYRAKGNAHARQLAQADWLIRERASGRYIATLSGGQTHYFNRSAISPSRWNPVQDIFSAAVSGELHLALAGLDAMWAELALDAETYAASSGLQAITEPVQLEYAGRDGFKRPLWLDYDAGKAWKRLQWQARQDGVALLAISGYRSAHYQMGIFRRKLARGLSLADILQVNAAPGFSEHHSGRAIDIGTPGHPPAVESFEHSAAYAWLATHAAGFGFRLSYPRGNRHGISYEPWHWYWIGSAQS